ncbi:cytochrome c oxidase accessory protein CcoG, partial [Rhodobacterales bacterium HKCCE2091]|nr:cytochrome c oxidase accessory protein CcoG [Rhodobacterales bacterium HKCCE2091]
APDPAAPAPIPVAAETAAEASLDPVAARIAAGEPGDCIDCMACVNVCPMGIDIRNGQQLECITCALCIDACDEIMDKIGKPRGLIDYVALSDIPVEQAGGETPSLWKHILRPRTIIYTALWSAFGIALILALFLRPNLEMTVAPVRNPIFITLSDGTIRNVYNVRLRNKHGEPRDFRVVLDGSPELAVVIEGADGDTVTVPADAQAQLRVYVSAPPGSAVAESDNTDIVLVAEDVVDGTTFDVATTFNGTGVRE